MSSDYSSLIEEVQITNELLLDNNNNLEQLVSSLDLVVPFLICLVVLKCSDMIHHLVDASFKGRK